MLNPYFLMTLLYFFVAVLAAFDASLLNFNLLPWFNGVRWLRIHFITLGMLTEMLFGALPILLAARRKLPKPAIRWDVWLLLNAGLVVLLAGIPSINQQLIFAGGTLIFLATLLLAWQLGQMGGGARQPSSASAKFYVTGLVYLLVGILIGTGLWLGWSDLLHIKVPLEAHIHANNWGFLSLVFAGLLIDLLPMLSGKPLAQPGVLQIIYWCMTLGALGLVAGPWLGGLLIVMAPGLLLHIVATVWLVLLLVRGLASADQLRRAGGWHLASAYIWILLPVLVAPLVLLKVTGFVGGDIEATAPQALIYGWVLQFGLALIPFLLQRYLAGDEQAHLGGDWWSLLSVNLGSALIWASIFILPLRANLQGVAYIFYGLAILPVALQAGRIVRNKLNATEMEPLVAAGD